MEDEVVDQELDTMLSDDPGADGTDVSEDDLGVPVEEEVPSVAQVSLEQALAVIKGAGMEAVPEALLSQEQTQQAQSVTDYASQIQVPEEVVAQGFDAEMNYRAQMAAQMAIQSAMAPIMGQQAAQHYASQINMPNSAGDLQQTMSAALGPNWYEAANNPQFAGMFELMLEGFKSKNTVSTPVDKAPVPKAEGLTRSAKVPSDMGPQEERLAQSLAAQLGMTTQQFLEAN